MTDEERFLVVLDETWSLLLQLGDLKDKAVLIGGQVIALHALARSKSAAIETSTDTGVVVTRGFTNEPDLLFDLDEDMFGAERLTEVLKDRGFKWLRGYRWGKTLANGVDILVDFFRSPELTENAAPLQMTPLPDANLVLRRTEVLTIRLGASVSEWRVPDPFGFMTLKVRAKLEQRPGAAKDSFDLYVFVKLLGVNAVNASLDSAPARASALRKQLAQLFWDENAPGTQDVLREAGLQGREERELLAREVVDLFAQLG